MCEVIIPGDILMGCQGCKLDPVSPSELACINMLDGIPLIPGGVRGKGSLFDRSGIAVFPVDCDLRGCTAFRTVSRVTCPAANGNVNTDSVTVALLARLRLHSLKQDTCIK